MGPFFWEWVGGGKGNRDQGRRTRLEQMDSHPHTRVSGAGGQVMGRERAWRKGGGGAERGGMGRTVRDFGSTVVM